MLGSPAGGTGDEYTIASPSLLMPPYLAVVNPVSSISCAVIDTSVSKRPSASRRTSESELAYVPGNGPVKSTCPLRRIVVDRSSLASSSV